LKIYLFLLDHVRFFFFQDESEDSDDPADAEDRSIEPQPGMRGWILTRYQKFRSAWQEADSGALLWMRRSWHWLHSWAHPDEVMLSRLWKARKIDLHYPSSRSADVAGTMWSDYLRTQWRRHLVWLIVNGLIAPFAFLLFVLPGPNLIGYWFAYRAIHHTLVVWGIGRVRRNKIPTEFSPMAALDLPIERNDDGKSRHAALAGAATRLDEHVAWYKGPRTPRAEGQTSVIPTPSEPRPANFPTEQS
jgi:Mitochondrial K+-H+ exchange-related